MKEAHKKTFFNAHTSWNPHKEDDLKMKVADQSACVSKCFCLFGNVGIRPAINNKIQKDEIFLTLSVIEFPNSSSTHEIMGNYAIFFHSFKDIQPFRSAKKFMMLLVEVQYNEFYCNPILFTCLSRAKNE
ncbi:unnamed protein product [Ilex paraguariensis]|uniref:Uncharacterized protein n=1 Tax=Ilex paraguariensis TaxID=185542 RepID=A0ABC8RBJ0_9AQUA